MRYRHILVLIGLVSLSVVALGCGKKQVNTSVPVVESGAKEDVSKELQAKYETVEEAVEAEVSSIKYDIPSIIYGARGEYENSEYVVDIFLQDIVRDDTQSEEADEEKPTDYEIPEEAKSVKDFLDLTETSKEDYEDYGVAFNNEKDYLVGVVKPVKGKEVAVEQAIRNFIVSQAEGGKDVYRNYQFETHNGHFVIVVASDSENIKTSILGGMANIDSIIGEAVEFGFNKQNTETVIEEVTEEETEATEEVTEDTTEEETTEETDVTEEVAEETAE